VASAAPLLLLLCLVHTPLAWCAGSAELPRCCFTIQYGTVLHGLL